LLPPSDDPVAAELRRQREEQRRQRRQQQGGPILDRLKRWLDEQRPQALPKSALGQAVGYALNNWEALSRYRERGYLAIDNNLSERTLRAVALGRNNWGVLGSETGGRTAAVLYTVVGTCKHLGIDPFAYLKEALPGLSALGEKPAAEQLREWLPDRWLLRRGRDSPARRDPRGAYCRTAGEGDHGRDPWGEVAPGHAAWPAAIMPPRRASDKAPCRPFADDPSGHGGADFAHLPAGGRGADHLTPPRPVASHPGLACRHLHHRSR
jgi:hypothetical protein